MGGRCLQDQALGRPHLPMQEPDRVLFMIVGPERVRTDHLGEIAGAMREGALQGAHFVDDDGDAALHGLPSGLRARHAAADDV